MDSQQATGGISAQKITVLHVLLLISEQGSLLSPSGNKGKTLAFRRRLQFDCLLIPFLSLSLPLIGQEKIIFPGNSIFGNPQVDIPEQRYPDSSSSTYSFLSGS